MKYGRIASKSMMFITSHKKAKWFGAAANRTRNSAPNQTIHSVSITKNGSEKLLWKQLEVKSACL